ncbi:hypothetical protein FOA52_006631 [Chlamydomonas sp. UWO 241]|nr:hypothetical protein FOA52_006631 [Chlamydomonas sp. UWO 241]
MRLQSPCSAGTSASVRSRVLPVGGSRRKVVAASVTEEGSALGVKERWQRIQDGEDDLEIANLDGMGMGMGRTGSAEQLQLDRASARRTRMQRDLLEIKAQEPEAHSDPETTSGLADALPAPRVSLVSRVVSALAGQEHRVQHLWSAVVKIGAAAVGAVFFSPEQMRRRLVRARSGEERARRAAGALATLPGILAAAVATTEAEANALRDRADAKAAKAAKEGEVEAAQRGLLSPAGAMRSRLQVVLVSDRSGVDMPTLLRLKTDLADAASADNRSLADVELQVSSTRPSGRPLNLTLPLAAIADESQLRDADDYVWEDHSETAKCVVSAAAADTAAAAIDAAEAAQLVVKAAADSAAAAADAANALAAAARDDNESAVASGISNGSIVCVDAAAAAPEDDAMGGGVEGDKGVGMPPLPNIGYLDAVLLVAEPREGEASSPSKRAVWYTRLADAAGSLKEKGFTHVVLPAHALLPQTAAPHEVEAEARTLRSACAALRAAGLVPVSAIPLADATSAPSEGALGRLHGWLGFGGWSLSGARPRDSPQQHHPASLQALVANTVGLDAVSVGEGDGQLGWDAGAVWDAPAALSRTQDTCRQALCDWVDAHHSSAAARDVPTAALLRRAAATSKWSLMSDARGKAPGLIGWWPSKAVTYVEADSTAQSSAVAVLPELLPACYAYVLTHPGLPSIPLSAMGGADASLTAAVTELLALRRRAGVRSDAHVSIMRADDDSYLGIVTGSDSQICVKLGPRYTMAPDVPFETDGWRLAAQGRQYAVWERPLSARVGMR